MSERDDVEATLSNATATAILGVDTLFGGDVLSESGTGRVVADSWFSDRPMPDAYFDEDARLLRASGGVAAATPDRAAATRYAKSVDLPGAISRVAAEGRALGGLRGAYLEGLAGSLQVMWELALELLGEGPAVPYERCVLASTGAPPSPSRPAEKREQVAALLDEAFHEADRGSLVFDVDSWRLERIVPRGALGAIAKRFVADLDAAAVRNLLPHLPAPLREVPRANVRFLPIPDAWFSGSMNYFGRARKPDGSPEYEATYEINEALLVSSPELMQLVAHEVVPGHVTTFALLQALHAQGALPFEATVLTMATRGAALFEGIANNALLTAFGVKEVSEIPDPDLRIGLLLALLQDDAKNEASYLTWGEGRPREEVAARLRQDFLVSEERADKLSGAWGRHPLLGRMYLPAYRAGTEKVAALRRLHPPERILPALYGVGGLVDVVTIDSALG